MFNSPASTSEISTRTLLFRHALAAAFRAWCQTVPTPPESLPTLLQGCRKGLQGLCGPARDALAEVRARLFRIPGREAEAESWWNESVATAAFAGRLAELHQVSVAAAFCGGLLHRAGEALALKMLARVEREYRLQMDRAACRDWCSGHGHELLERLVQAWRIAPDIATCALGWTRFGELTALSGENAALYFGRLFAIELLQPGLCVPGAIDHAARDFGVNREVIAQVRAEEPRVRELLRVLG
jgi:HDOD domain